MAHHRSLSLGFVFLQLVLVLLLSTAARAEERVVGGRFSVRFRTDRNSNTWTTLTTFEIRGNGREDVDEQARRRYRAHLIGLSLLPAPNVYLAYLDRRIFANHFDLYIVGYSIERVRCSPAPEESADFEGAETAKAECAIDSSFEDVGETLDTSDVSIDLTDEETLGVLDLLAPSPATAYSSPRTGGSASQADP